MKTIYAREIRTALWWADLQMNNIEREDRGAWHSDHYRRVILKPYSKLYRKAFLHRLHNRGYTVAHDRIVELSMVE